MLRTLGFLLIAPVLMAQAPAPSVDSILDKHFEALGGLAKLKSVKSLRMSMKMVGGGMEIPVSLEVVKPGKIRTDVSIQGMSMVTVVDGAKGWKINPMGGYGGGKPEPEPLTPEEIRMAESQQDWDGPLVDYKAKGHTLEYLGQEALEGSPTHKLKVTEKSGDTFTIFLDADSYLTVKQIRKMTLKGKDIESDTLMGDYKQVEGIMMPHAMEMQPQGAPMRFKALVQKVEVNPTIDPARFKMPELSKPAAPAEPAKKAEPVKK